MHKNQTAIKKQSERDSNEWDYCLDGRHTYTLCALSSVPSSRVPFVLSVSRCLRSRLSWLFVVVGVLKIWIDYAVISISDGHTVHKKLHRASGDPIAESFLFAMI